MASQFIELTLGNHLISHGYDVNNNEIIEEVNQDKFSKKLVSISRIKSVSKKFILTDYLDGRWIYWEYLEDYQYVKSRLIEQ